MRALQLGSVIGGYRIDELIGRGGMGVVYRVSNVTLGRIYALKVLAPELADDEKFQARFRREMKIAASLHHPNVVAIHHAGEGDGMLFFVMDFISGTDLHEVMRKSGPLEPSRATALLTQLADALDAAHRRGLVHRDVKPENVLMTVLDGEEHAYLTDFGLAKKLHASTGFAGLTREGAVVGTVDYMSPEQITGRHTDARTDIYALGCVFFQMLSGHVPYERENSVATMFAHVHEPPPRIAGELCERYPNLGGVVEKATAKEPEDRYMSAGDFARDAAAALTGARYTGPPTVVATGEATPLPKHEAESYEAPLAATAADSSTDPGARLDSPSTVIHKTTAPHGTTSHSTSPPSAPPDHGAPRRRLGRNRWALVVGLMCLAGGIAAWLVLSTSSSSVRDRFAAAATPVRINRVTGSGTATVQLRGDVATVTVHVHGLVNQMHWMHIHAEGELRCPSPGDATMTDGHLFVSAADGDALYGKPVTSLTTAGDTSGLNNLDPSGYPVGGTFRYSRPITVPGYVAKMISQGDAFIVVHGIDWNHNGVYDNTLGPGGEYGKGERGAPALCGNLIATKTAAVNDRHSEGTVYSASVRPYVDVSSTQQTARSGWFCHPVGTTAPGRPRRTDTPRRST